MTLIMKTGSKKTLTFLLAITIALTLLAACGGGGSSDGNNSSNSSSSSTGNASNSASSGNNNSTSPASDSGSSSSNNSNTSANSGGVPDVVWARNFGGQSEGYFRSVASSGNGYVTVGWSLGATYGTVDWEGFEGNGDVDAIIVKFDANGNVVWQKNFGGYNSDRFQSVVWDGDGYVAVGGSESFGLGDWDEIQARPMGGGPIIVKFDENGDVVWKKAFDWGWSFSFNSVIAVSDGYVAVGNSNQDTADWDGFEGKGYGDAIIVKLDKNGDIVWKNNFGGERADEFVSVISDGTGYVAVGTSNENSFGNGDWEGVEGNGTDEAIIVKYDVYGNFVWAKSFGGSSWDCFESLVSTGDGYLVVGYSHRDSFGNGDWTGIEGTGGFYDALIVKFDEKGGLEWKKKLGGGAYTELYSITAVSDGYLSAGYTGSIGRGDFEGLESKGGNDALIVKFDSNGDVIWMKNFGGGNTESFRTVMQFSDGLIAVGYSTTGSFGTGDWIGVEANGSRDQIIVKFG